MLFPGSRQAHSGIFDGRLWFLRAACRIPLKVRQLIWTGSLSFSLHLHLGKSPIIVLIDLGFCLGSLLFGGLYLIFRAPKGCQMWENKHKSIHTCFGSSATRSLMPCSSLSRSSWRNLCSSTIILLSRERNLLSSTLLSSSLNWNKSLCKHLGIEYAGIRYNFMIMRILLGTEAQAMEVPKVLRYPINWSKMPRDSQNARVLQHFWYLSRQRLLL